MMRTRNLSFGWTALGVFSMLAFSASATQAALIVDDVVDDDGSGWTLTGSAAWDNQAFGLITPDGPLAGDDLVGFLAGTPADASKTFTGILLAEGTYTATFDVGNHSNNPILPAGFTGAMLAGGASMTDLLSSSDTTAPAGGAWGQWSLTYLVPNGDSRIGDVLSFSMSQTAGSGNGTFDDLEIDFEPVPEPGSFGLLTISGLVGMTLISRRRRRNRRS